MILVNCICPKCENTCLETNHLNGHITLWCDICDSHFKIAVGELIK